MADARAELHKVRATCQQLKRDVDAIENAVNGILQDFDTIHRIVGEPRVAHSQQTAGPQQAPPVATTTPAPPPVTPKLQLPEEPESRGLFGGRKK